MSRLIIWNQKPNFVLKITKKNIEIAWHSIQVPIHKLRQPIHDFKLLAPRFASHISDPVLQFPLPVVSCRSVKSVTTLNLCWVEESCAVLKLVPLKSFAFFILLINWLATRSSNNHISRSAFGGNGNVMELTQVAAGIISDHKRSNFYSGVQWCLNSFQAVPVHNQYGKWKASCCGALVANNDMQPLLRAAQL